MAALFQVAFLFFSQVEGHEPRLVAKIDHRQAIFAMEVSSDGKLLLVLDRLGCVVIDIEKRMELSRLDGIWSSPGRASISPDSKLMAIGGYEGPTLKVWESRSGVEVLTIGKDVGYRSYCAFQSDAKRIVFTCRIPDTGEWEVRSFDLQDRGVSRHGILMERPSCIALTKKRKGDAALFRSFLG